MSKRHKALNEPINDVLFFLPPEWLRDESDQLCVVFEGKQYKDGDIIDGNIITANGFPVKMRVQVRIGINDKFRARAFLCKPKEAD